MNEVRWGIIGTGTIAQAFAADFAYAKTGELRAVASRNKQSADDFAERFNIDLAMVDYFSLINSHEVDVIYLGVPHSLHYELTKACILAGKSVLCEKPFTLNEAQAAELFDLAAEHEVFVMEAMWTRFNPAVEQALEWIEEGEIGTLQSIQASLCFKGSQDPNGRLLNKELGGGALLDVGIYPIFLAQLFFGKPDFMQNQALVGDTDVDVFEQLLLGWDDGQMASLESSIVSQQPNRAILSGSDGYIEFGHNWHLAKSLTLVKDGGAEHNIEFDFPGLGYQFEVEEVNRCIEEGLTQSPNHSWQDTLNLLATMDEIRQDIGVYYPGEPEPCDHDCDIEHHHHEHAHHQH
ncbi:Gfo/Idh/MocA family protein [Marinomonas ostreistagni]|uniref:Gfo/Idh/MocA family protein n=1 Tax=Marinomonas ostreistagni TaxID=359209 RepID=UPI0019506781|nr:Gfo/Idh/MocA family oxidoreductase [Marinomonas ostreistagni]MBM6551181.1 Gfo/Idh/MocA family oxidoreductase [Marinomonas ostreistagni]